MIVKISNGIFRKMYHQFANDDNEVRRTITNDFNDGRAISRSITRETGGVVSRQILKFENFFQKMRKVLRLIIKLSLMIVSFSLFAYIFAGFHVLARKYHVFSEKHHVFCALFTVFFLFFRFLRGEQFSYALQSFST